MKSDWSIVRPCFGWLWVCRITGCQNERKRFFKQDQLFANHHTTINYKELSSWFSFCVLMLRSNLFTVLMEMLYIILKNWPHISIIMSNAYLYTMWFCTWHKSKSLCIMSFKKFYSFYSIMLYAYNVSEKWKSKCHA